MSQLIHEHVRCGNWPDCLARSLDVALVVVAFYPSLSGAFTSSIHSHS